MIRTVTIGGREFRIGATYAPKKAGSKARPRIFYGRHRWQGYIQWAPTTLVVPQPMGADSWVRWAGEEVRDDR